MPISAAAAMSQLPAKPAPAPAPQVPQEIQVFSEMRSDQLHQLQYQIMVLRYLQGRRMPDQNVGARRERDG